MKKIHLMPTMFSVNDISQIFLHMDIDAILRTDERVFIPFKTERLHDILFYSIPLYFDVCLCVQLSMQAQLFKIVFTYVNRSEVIHF